MALNRQLVFDTAVAALYKQGVQSMSETDDQMCAYHGAEGRKCAVGHLLADNRYSAAMEGEAASRAIVLDAVHTKFGVASGDDHYFLRDMQQDLHDNYFGEGDNNQTYREYLEDQAEFFAARYNLKVDVNLFTTE